MVEDWCRHCDRYGKMTLEHVPAKATGNSSQVDLYRELNGQFEKVTRAFTAGHALPTLCGDCNNGAQRRGLPDAYTAWHQDVVAHVRTFADALHHATGEDPNNVWHLCRRDGRAAMVPMEHGKGLDSMKMMNLHPGRIARQVLSGILAVQNTPYLLRDNPVLTQAYFSEDAASIAPFTLHVALANAGTGYFETGISQGTFNLVTGRFDAAQSWLLACTPFVFGLVKGEQEPFTSTRIEHWFQYPVHETFGKRNRIVEYPIGRPGDLVIDKLYNDLEQLPP
ncbi:hypothetical protein AB0F85_25165 [Nocardia fluminea]|uniref:hypothetical protein n=1 Tax=Nocardia fluminea TaxID=134984 RepID=UPI0033EBFF7D